MWQSIQRSLRQVAILALIVGAMLAAMPAAAVETKSLHLASTEWPPFTDERGKARFALDLVETALQRLKISSSTVFIQESTLTSSLLGGEYDGSAAVWKDDVREKALVYSQPYLENRLILVGRKGSDVSAKTLADLAGKRLALVQGYSYGDAVKGSKGPAYVPSRSEEDSLQTLLSGRADYTLMDQLVVEYLLKNYSAETQAKLAFGSEPMIVRTLHLAIKRTIPDAQSIIDRFNAELTGMVADRSYHRLLRLDWIDADIDGDGIVESVPSTDQPGPNAPDHSYQLHTNRSQSESSKHFYLGGKVYPSWSAVPEVYKAPRPGGATSDGTTISIFSFRF